MKLKIKIILWVILFTVVFAVSALVRINMLGSAPMKLLDVGWNEEMGDVYADLSYENDYGHRYDLYIPTGLDESEPQQLILFIHGGSFNSGAKEDGDAWCKFYASKGYVTATLDYSLQTVHEDASLYRMNDEIGSCITAVKVQCEKLGYKLDGLALCGVSAGGTLAMNYAYSSADTSEIPVKFVFQLAAPADLEPSEWDILKKVNKLKSDAELASMLTGASITDEMLQSGEHTAYINGISPARLVTEHSVPTLVGYGLKDHLVPLHLKHLLIDALEAYGVEYDYIEFPNCNHGMYRDLDIMQSFIDKSLEYCEKYFGG